MSQLRWGPLEYHWVIIASDRARAVRGTTVEPDRGTITSCPFCYGNER